jgi:hypothetical protein
MNDGRKLALPPEKSEENVQNISTPTRVRRAHVPTECKLGAFPLLHHCNQTPHIPVFCSEYFLVIINFNTPECVTEADFLLYLMTFLYIRDYTRRV